jgi:hypothetical protein
MSRAAPVNSVLAASAVFTFVKVAVGNTPIKRGKNRSNFAENRKRFDVNFN